MGSGNKAKGKKTNFGDYYRSPEEYEAMIWCLKNKIVAVVMVVSGDDFLARISGF